MKLGVGPGALWSCFDILRMNLNRGVPQGSPLSSFLFGVYVADMFKSRICCRLDLRRMVLSYVDDRVILVSTESKEETKQQLIE